MFCFIFTIKLIDHSKSEYVRSLVIPEMLVDAEIRGVCLDLFVVGHPLVLAVLGSGGRGTLPHLLIGSAGATSATLNQPGSIPCEFEIM